MKITVIHGQGHKVQPIIKSMEESEIIILDSPNYVMEMSGNMKNLMDHFAYRWITHRPHANMFKKVGLTISSSAGAPPSNTVKSMAKQLKWMGVPKVYKFPLISNALIKSKLIRFYKSNKFNSYKSNKNICKMRRGTRIKIKSLFH